MSMLKKSHLIDAKRILRYFKGTLKFLTAKSERRTCLIGYSDVDWHGDKTDRISTSSYVFLYNEATISWCTKKK